MKSKFGRIFSILAGNPEISTEGMSDFLEGGELGVPSRSAPEGVDVVADNERLLQKSTVSTREEPSAWADSSSRVLRVTLYCVSPIGLLDQSDELGCLAEGCELEVTLCTQCVGAILLDS